MATQTAVAFANRRGLKLFGVLHKPDDQPASDLAVILLSPGVKMRVGPQCLYRRMTDHFVRLGLPVLRFDFYGLGDSEGTLTEELLRDVYNHIEVGRFVDDTVDAMAWMEQQQGTKQFILSGLCGGAITGLLCGSRDRRVAGLLGLGITAVLASRAADESRYMTANQLAYTRRRYLRKLLQPTAWVRLLRFKTDYRAVLRSLAHPLRSRAQATTTEAAPPENDNANPLFPPAFFAMLESKRPMLLVFGGSDRLQWEFDEKFVARHQKQLASLPPLYDVHIVKNANHVLSWSAWQSEMLEVSTRWLNTHFSRHLNVSTVPRTATHRTDGLAGAET